jgi:hypothetical protein
LLFGVRHRFSPLLLCVVGYGAGGGFIPAASTLTAGGPLIAGGPLTACNDIEVFVCSQLFFLGNKHTSSLGTMDGGRPMVGRRLSILG